MGQAIVYSHRLQGKSIEFVMANTQTAVLGGGCFWCVEAALQQLEGVLRIESGYMGGDLDHPTYEQVCAGNTGHVEVVRVEFDPAIISYSELLEVFFTAHDPTTLDRQGNDVGTQYRSVIFVADAAQRKKAEGYHQSYFANNSHRPYCLFAVAPKVAKVRAKYSARIKRAS